MASLIALTVTKTITASASATATSRASPQGGVLEGSNPSHYDSKNPIILFIIQVRHICPVLSPVMRLARTTWKMRDSASLAWDSTVPFVVPGRGYVCRLVCGRLFGSVRGGNYEGYGTLATANCHISRQVSSSLSAASSTIRCPNFASLE